MMMSIAPNFLVLDMARMAFSLLKYPSPFRACLGNGGFKWMEED
jgi:hypothetical protein